MAAGGTTQAAVSPPWALGQCDRCGFHYRLNQLHEEVYDERPNGLRVCSTCLDKDNPQLQLGRMRVDDPQSLLNPRPDVNRPGSTGLFGWMPIGNVNQFVSCQVGNLTVLVT